MRGPGATSGRFARFVKANVLPICVCFLATGAPSAIAESASARISLGRNHGIHVWSDVTNPAQGHQQTVRQDYQFLRALFDYEVHRWAFSIGLEGTADSVESGGGRRETFDLFPWSEVRSNSLWETPPAQTRDSAHSVRSETYNTIDYKGPNPFDSNDATGVDTRVAFAAATAGFRFFPWRAKVDREGLFLSGGLGYENRRMTMGDGYVHRVANGSYVVFPDQHFGLSVLRRYESQISFLPAGVGYLLLVGTLEIEARGSLVTGRGRAKEISRFEQLYFQLKGTGWDLGLNVSIGLGAGTSLEVFAEVRRLHLVGGARVEVPGYFHNFVLNDTMHNISENRIGIGLAHRLAAY